MLSNEKIDQVGSSTYLGSIISKDGGSSEDVKSRIAKAQCFFSQLKKVWKNRKISLQNKIITLEATVMKVFNYGSEGMGAPNSGGIFTRCFPDKLPTDCAGYPAD